MRNAKKKYVPLSVADPATERNTCVKFYHHNIIFSRISQFLEDRNIGLGSRRGGGIDPFVLSWIHH